MIATSINANEHFFPLAFALVKEEKTNSWSWFLFAIRFHVTKKYGICLIVNRHVGIKATL